VVSPEDHELTDVAVLFYRDDYVSRSFRAVENMIELLKMIFDMLSYAWGDFNVTTRIFKFHQTKPSSLNQ
jgi:hypothetical protein